MSLRTSLGGRDSNSFITVTEANNFIKNNLPDAATEWLALSTYQREYRLILAAMLMSYLPWAGVTTYCGQALCFPRRIRGNHLGCPCEVQETQAYIAYSVIHRGIANRPTVEEETPGEKVKSVSMGGLLSITFGGEGPTTGNVLDKIIRSAHFLVYLRLKKYFSQVRGGSIKSKDDDDFPECSTTTTTTTTTTTISTTTSTSSSTSSSSSSTTTTS